jgi:hypothetical protein
MVYVDSGQHMGCVGNINRIILFKYYSTKSGKLRWNWQTVCITQDMHFNKLSTILSCLIDTFYDSEGEILKSNILATLFSVCNR